MEKLELERLLEEGFLDLSVPLGEREEVGGSTFIRRSYKEGKLKVDYIRDKDTELVSVNSPNEEDKLYFMISNVLGVSDVGVGKKFNRENQYAALVWMLHDRPFNPKEVANVVLGYYRR